MIPILCIDLDSNWFPVLIPPLKVNYCDINLYIHLACLLTGLNKYLLIYMFTMCIYAQNSTQMIAVFIHRASMFCLIYCNCHYHRLTTIITVKNNNNKVCKMRGFLCFTAYTIIELCLLRKLAHAHFWKYEHWN